MEFHILSTLGFDITFPTSLRFMERYLRMLGDDPVIANFSQFLIELALIDIRMLKYPAQVVAASAITLAYKSMARMMYYGSGGVSNQADNDKKME